MDTLKKFFPYSFGASEVKDLVIKIIVYIVAAFIAGAVLAVAGAITGWIPVLGGLIGLVLSIVGGVVELYVLIGIVLLVLDYLKVLK